MILAFLVLLLLALSSSSVSITPGAVTSAPKGYVVSNLDPNFNSAHNDEIYAPNFQPGFEVGLTNTTIRWNSGNGYGKIGYSVGPWAYEETGGIPHFAVGPQCCNFKEVPHTQQFTEPEWANHYFSRAGLGPPGVTVENYTAVWGDPPSYVGLRTDWDWTVQVSLNWTNPELMNVSNEWGAIGIDTTQVIPSAPGELVYTLINFWMESNSSNYFASLSRGGRWVGGNLVTYHPIQITREGNETIKIDLSPYLRDTNQALGVQIPQDQPPVIAYVYLIVQGYNFEWNTTLWSFEVMTPTQGSTFSLSYALATVAFVGALAIATISLGRVFRKSVSPGEHSPPKNSKGNFRSSDPLICGAIIRSRNLSAKSSQLRTKIATE